MKKCIILFIIFFILISAISTTAQTGIIPIYSQVYDTYGNWAENDINTLLNLGIINGDGNFSANPQNNITRAEFTAILMRTISPNPPPPQASGFSDVDPSDWFYNVTLQAKMQGLIEGYNGQFRPYSPITREEIMLIISRLDFLNGYAYVSFSDIPTNYQYLTQLSNVIGSGIINGYENNTFRPTKTANRAECIAMTRRLLDAMQPQMPTVEQLEIIKSNSITYLNALYDARNNSASPDFNISLSTGMELQNNTARANLAKLISQESIAINQIISNLTINITEISKAIVKLEADYTLNIERTLNGESIYRAYNVKNTLGFVNLDGAWKVFETSERFYNPNKISLVWDYIYNKSPDLSTSDDMKGLDVISPTWYEINPNDNNIQAIPDFNYVKSAHAKGYEVWPLFKNAFGYSSTDDFLKNPAVRQKGIEELVKSMLQFGLDGLNVDFENMNVSNKPYFSQFMSELTFALHYIGTIASVDVSKYEPTSLTWSMCYDRTALGKSADYVMLMAYDQNGTFSTKAGSVAQLSWVENAVNVTLKEIPSEKLMLGIPFYTRLWVSQNDKVVSTMSLSMEAAISQINKNNATLVWDTKSGQTLATWYVGTQKYNIWLENAYSISLKSSLVDKYNLSGTAAWRKGFETADVWDVLNNIIK